MFDIGFLEILVIGILGLLVLGPERLPGAVRTVSLWLTKIRRSFQQIKLEIEREVDVSELKQQIHNDELLEKLAKIKADVENDVDKTRLQLAQEMSEQSYDISDDQPQPTDTLPDHEPLPDPEEDEQNEQPAKPSHHESNR